MCPVCVSKGGARSYIFSGAIDVGLLFLSVTNSGSRDCSGVLLLLYMPEELRVAVFGYFVM